MANEMISLRRRKTDGVESKANQAAVPYYMWQRRKTDQSEKRFTYPYMPYMAVLMLGMATGYIAYQMIGPGFHNAILAFIP